MTFQQLQRPAKRSRISRHDVVEGQEIIERGLRGVADGILLENPWYSNLLPGEKRNRRNSCRSWTLVTSGYRRPWPNFRDPETSRKVVTVTGIIKETLLNLSSQISFSPLSQNRSQNSLDISLPTNLWSSKNYAKSSGKSISPIVSELDNYKN